MKSRSVLSCVAACALWATLALPAQVLLAQVLPANAAEAVFPIASRIGIVPPAGLNASTAFPGFEDEQKNAFIRLIALPAAAFTEIEKTMTNDAMKKQGMVVEKRETMKLPSGNAILVIVKQNT